MYMINVKSTIMVCISSATACLESMYISCEMAQAIYFKVTSLPPKNLHNCPNMSYVNWMGYIDDSCQYKTDHVTTTEQINTTCAYIMNSTTVPM